MTLALGVSDKIEWVFSPQDGSPQKSVFVSHDPAVQGAREVIDLDEGLQLVRSDVTFTNDVMFPVDIGSVVKFHFRFAGTGRIFFEGLGQQGNIALTEHSAGVLFQQPGIRKYESYEAGQHEQAITLLATPDYLDFLVPDLAGQFPALLTVFSEGIFYAQLPRTPELVAAARAIFAPNVLPELEMSYRRARAEEILIDCIDLLIKSQRAVVKPLKSSDRARIEMARDIVSENIESPPRIYELARLVGINETKLMAGFKLMFDQTINEYLRNLRMERAHYLLTRTEASVTQIAFEVGYEFSSNFTNAYKRHFGTTPSETRRGSRNAG